MVHHFGREEEELRDSQEMSLRPGRSELDNC